MTEIRHPMPLDTGNGPPLVMLPGIQGRWEWIEPAIEALAARCRVITFSLPGEAGSGMPMPADAGFDLFAQQVDRVLDERGLADATVAGVSFGGLVAAYYAATRPARVRALVLASAVGPRWRPDWRVRWFIRTPRLMGLAFVATSPVRLYPEIRAARPQAGDRARFSLKQMRLAAGARFSPLRMARRLQLISTEDFVAHARRITAPTLVLTGEPALDRVVPVGATLEYAALVPGAVTAQLERTGHIGLVTQPDRFARIVGDFVLARAQDPPIAEAAS